MPTPVEARARAEHLAAGAMNVLKRTSNDLSRTDAAYAITRASLCLLRQEEEGQAKIDRLFKEFVGETVGG